MTWMWICIRVFLSFFIHSFIHLFIHTHFWLTANNLTNFVKNGRGFFYYRRVTNFIYKYKLNAMAPTWLPKSHSPTAIKATKSWIYSQNTQRQHFFPSLPYVLCSETDFQHCIWIVCVFFFLCILPFEWLFCILVSFCTNFAVESFFHSFVNCMALKFQCGSTEERKWIQRKKKGNWPENGKKKLHFIVAAMVFCSLLKRLSVCVCVYIYCVSLYEFSNWRWRVHNNQSTKVYSTERDEVH